MEIKDCITNRRSIRSYKNKELPISLVKEILDVSRWAPSHCNTQEGKFIIITNNEIKQKLVDMGGSNVILNAPVSILIIYPNNTNNIEYKDYVQSAAAIIQNIGLYAFSKDIGTCWINHLPRKSEIQKFFNLPQNLEPIGLITMGYFEKKPKNVPRKYRIDEITWINKDVPDDLKIKVHRLNRIARKIYYHLPTFIKKKINPIVDKKFVKKFENE